MPKQRQSRQTLFDQFTDYERRYPRIADALSRYAVVMQTYQTALSSYTEPRISISNSTVRLDQPSIR